MSANQDGTKVTKRFSDFAKTDNMPMPGDKMRMQDVIGNEYVFTAFRVMESKAVEGRECLQLQFHSDDGDHKIVFTNSTVLIKQCRSYEGEFPFRATIVRHGRYYTFK